jgi:ferredoxin
MKVTIDRDECTSCEVCWDDCPEVFAENEDDNLSEIVEKYQVDGDPGVGEVPEEHRDAVQECVDNCPAEVIHIED